MAAGFIKSTSVSLVSLVLVTSNIGNICGGQGEGGDCRVVLKEEVESKEDYLDYFCNGGVRTNLMSLLLYCQSWGQCWNSVWRA